MDRDPEAIRRLRDQIATSGLINPITVRASHTGFQLIAGLNRLEAYKLLQRTEIPAHVLEVDDTAAATIRLTENLTRSQLSPIEEAAQLHDLVEATAGGVDAVAATTGRTANWVLDRLEILDWDPELQQAVHEKKISASAAKRLARIPDPETRSRYVQQAATHGISARTAALWLQDAIALAQPAPPVSENSTIVQNPAPEMEIRVGCFACGTKCLYPETHPVRLCINCITAIQTACASGPALENTPEPTLPPAGTPG